MKTIILDTGYWIALFNPEKEKEKQKTVEEVTRLIDENNYSILIPFPTLYEFLNSKLSRKKDRVNLVIELSKNKYKKIYDDKYRDKALKKFSDQFSYSISDISLVDEVIKEMIEDDKLRTDSIVTFDEALKNYALSMNLEVI
jgi:predicted nucleic acid-binding protein